MLLWIQITCGGWGLEPCSVLLGPALRTGAAAETSIAFSTSPDWRVRYREKEVRRHAVLPHSQLSPLFQAALEATEEAVYNGLFQATTTSGMGRTYEAIPIDRVRQILEKYGIMNQLNND